jgi:integrase
VAQNYKFSSQSNQANVPGVAARHERKIVPKRRFQQGCLRKETRSWILYFWADVEKDGIIQRRKRSLRVGPNTLSKAEAQREAQPLLKSINDGDVITAGVLLRDFIPEWRRVVTPTLKPSTVEGMESSLRAHILPVLGNTLISNVDARQIQLLVNSMKTQAKKTKDNVVGDLLSILAAARGPQWRHQVPTVEEGDLYVGGREPGEPYSFSPEEIRAILAAFANTKWELFFMMLALTGLRAGEILGLRVIDCDLERNLIFVRQTAWEGRIIQGAKTKGSKNSVPMPSLVREKLEHYLRTHDRELLFANRKGGPYRRDKIVAKVLHPVLDRIGVPRKGRRVAFHAFRHGLASMLVDLASPAVAQRQLRHADAATTLGIYAHVIGSGHKDAVEAIQAVCTGR